MYYKALSSSEGPQESTEDSDSLFSAFSSSLSRSFSLLSSSSLPSPLLSPCSFSSDDEQDLEPCESSPADSASEYCDVGEEELSLSEESSSSDSTRRRFGMVIVRRGRLCSRPRVGLAAASKSYRICWTILRAYLCHVRCYPKDAQLVKS